MIKVEISTGSNQQRLLVQVLGDMNERLLVVDGPRDVALAALIEYLRGLTMRQVAE